MENDFGQHSMDIDAVATGKRIQELRKELGLRVTDISDYMGFWDPQAVYKWLRGESLPTLRNMYQLSRLFGTTIDDIIRCAEVETQAQRLVDISVKRRGEGERPSPRSVLESAVSYCNFTDQPAGKVSQFFSGPFLRNRGHIRPGFTHISEKNI